MTAISEVLHQGPMITKAKKAMVILHGRGGTARGMLQLAQRLCDNNIYIAAPQAVNNSWYPYSFLSDEILNQPYLSQSISAIQEVIEEISVCIPKENIYIVGFSQGACLSLEVTARSAEKYGGIIAFTGGLIGSQIDNSKYQGNYEGTSILMTNGNEDAHVPLSRSEASKKLLQQLGASVALKVYPGRAHTILEEEIMLARAIIAGV